MKKCFLSTVFILFSLVLVSSAFASETDTPALEDFFEKGEIIYMDDEITVRSFGNDQEVSDAIFNHPDSVTATNENPFLRSSVTGPGGRASIVDADSGRAVFWSVKPATAWPYNFSGTVQLRYHSGFARDASVGGMGALGSTVSGMVTMNKNNGGTAYLVGTAYAILVINTQFYREYTLHLDQTD
ncbi:hypothetical protein LAV72_17430 [Lysinibacillus xylanilyticus]|uniref:hypothetical protein n=1 Tax=Lysinibacillus xylanilyticus TaxID=582475 RepID=UPI002B24A045|nr:hypothetical protein [Lysinibacillus xylanilyticus]MEB2301403.1 hypothetical protein [Lysinibacillus xylanilyticus]